MQNMNLLSSAAACALLGILVGSSSIAYGAEIEFAFSGVVGALPCQPSGCNPPWDTVVVGDPWSITYCFESTTPEIDPLSSIHNYEAITSYTLTIGSSPPVTKSGPAGFDFNFIRVTNNYPATFDHYEVHINLPGNERWIMQLIDTTGAAFTSTALPRCGGIDLADFEVHQSGLVYGQFIEITGSVASHNCAPCGPIAPCQPFCPAGQTCFEGCGTLVKGVECTLFQSDAGGLYLLGDLDGFGIGDRVTVTGCIDPDCITFCLQGDGCILNNTIGPCPCLNVSNEKVLCPLDDSGCYTYGFDITNKSGLPAQYLTLSAHPIGMPDVTIQPSDINFLTQYGSLLEDGETASIEVTICGGDPGDQVCFQILLLTERAEKCCTQLRCIELPQCDCGQLSCQFSFASLLFPGDLVDFTFSFTLDNLSPFPVDEVHFIAANFEQGDFVKDVFDLSPPLAPGASLPMSVSIEDTAQGEEFCFFVLLQHPGEKPGKDCCCGFEKCITAPEFTEFNPGGGINLGLLPGACCLPSPQEECVPSTFGACTALGGSFSFFTSCFCTDCPQLVLCPADLNFDEQVDGLDLNILLDQWTGLSTYAPCPPFKAPDLNHDCKTNGVDLALLLGAWGNCR